MKSNSTLEGRGFLELGFSCPAKTYSRRAGIHGKSGLVIVNGGWRERGLLEYPVESGELLDQLVVSANEVMVAEFIHHNRPRVRVSLFRGDL
jgi:hypothetical protein